MQFQDRETSKIDDDLIKGVTVTYAREKSYSTLGSLILFTENYPIELSYGFSKESQSNCKEDLKKVKELLNG